MIDEIVLPYAAGDPRPTRQAEGAFDDLPEVPNFNVCPTVQVAAVQVAAVQVAAVMSDGDARVNTRRCVEGSSRIGMTSRTAGRCCSMRAKTIAEKPAFKAVCRARRCIIFTVGFYE